MATQVQNRRGTTAEHSTFTGANGELTVDTTKRTLVVHDGATAGGRPLLREDQSNLPTSAPTTGIYNASGSLAISTGGTGRLFVDSSGRVGIGTSSPGAKIHIAGNTSTDIVADLVINRASSGTGIQSGPNLTFQTATANETVALQATQGRFGVWNFGGGSWTERMSIDSSGRVGIGTASPGARLDVTKSGASTTPNLLLSSGGVGDPSSVDPSIHFAASGLESPGTTKILSTGAFNTRALAFHTGTDTAGTERARIDSSGRLLVGTSTTSSNTTALFQGYGGVPTGGAHLRLAAGTSSPANGSNLGLVLFSDSEHTNCAYISADRDGGTWSASSKPTRLVFSTTADGASSPTERMRISQNGGTLWRSDGATSTHDLGNSNTSITGEVITVSAFRNTVNDTFKFLTCIRQGFAVALEIRDDGDVYNVNGTYGSLSDAKLKENIVDANSQWDDIKQLRVRNYNFKPETNNSTHKQIGVIAQEIENVSPGLVNTVADRDAEGNDLGTVTKSVNYSVLYMKAVKALQEAMERIETLEAKVAALESA